MSQDIRRPKRPGPTGGSIEPKQNMTEAPKKFELKEKIREMLGYGMPILDRFPRRHRKLADSMRESMLGMLRLVVRLEKRYYKKTTLEDLDIELQVLRDLIVVASEKDYYGDRFPPPLSLKQREVWTAKYTSVLGYMIHGYWESIQR